MDYIPPPPVVHEYKINTKWRGVSPDLIAKGKKKYHSSNKSKIFREERKRYREVIKPLNKAIVSFLETAKYFPDDESVRKLFDQLLNHRLRVIKELDLQEIERYHFSKPMHQRKTVTKP